MDNLNILGLIEKTAVQNKGCEEESPESIYDLLEDVKDYQQARALKLTHASCCLSITGKQYIKRMDEAMEKLTEMRYKMIEALTLFNRANLKDRFEPCEVYEFRNYLYEGLERFEASRIIELCRKEEDINKIIWGLNATIDDLKDTLKEED